MLPPQVDDAPARRLGDTFEPVGEHRAVAAQAARVLPGRAPVQFHIGRLRTSAYLHIFFSDIIAPHEGVGLVTKPHMDYSTKPCYPEFLVLHASAPPPPFRSLRSATSTPQPPLRNSAPLHSLRSAPRSQPPLRSTASAPQPPLRNLRSARNLSSAPPASAPQPRSTPQPPLRNLRSAQQASAHNSAPLRSLRSRCWIKKTDSRQRESALTPGILTMEEYRRLWLTWHGGQVKLGRDGYTDSIISCTNDVQDMKYVTFSVVEHRNPVHWRFELPPVPEKLKDRVLTGCDLQWVPYNKEEELPLEPLVGGFEKEKLYIARAKHRGSLTPGKFVPSTGKAYISWGSQANEKTECEVLCGFDGYWVPAVEDKIPTGAFVAGYSEDALERLYVGRAEYEGHLIPAKVQPSHKVCYFSYEGREVASKKYEILVINKNERCVNNVYSQDRVSYMQPDVEEYDGPDSDYSNDTDEERV
ncbi:hypothetical protein MSG28_010821 [Choristoneura fumiferana]|nr:hypothetical protein MSG28_010821 [Choristoneura fumiferana]